MEFRTIFLTSHNMLAAVVTLCCVASASMRMPNAVYDITVAVVSGASHMEDVMAGGLSCANARMPNSVYPCAQSPPSTLFFVNDGLIDQTCACMGKAWRGRGLHAGVVLTVL